MKILGLDSSGLVASVAVVEDDGVNSNLLAEYTVNYKKTHSQTLLPMLDEIANMPSMPLPWQEDPVPLRDCASVLQLPRDLVWRSASRWYTFLLWTPWLIIYTEPIKLSAR